MRSQLHRKAEDILSVEVHPQGTRQNPRMLRDKTDDFIGQTRISLMKRLNRARLASTIDVNHREV